MGLRILQICPKPPLPLIDGGCIAMNALTQGLTNAGHEVQVIAMVTSKHPHVPEAFSSEYSEKHKYSHVHIRTELNPIRSLSCLLKSKNYNLDRFYSSEFNQKLIDILSSADFDVVILDSLYSSPYLSTVRKCSNAKVVYRAHNVECEIWDGLSKKSSNPLKSWYLNSLSNSLEIEEVSIINNVDAIATITDEDERWINQHSQTPTLRVPFGIDIESDTVSGATSDTVEFDGADHVFHFGSMDWEPNIEATRWLLEEVWPLVLKELPEARLVLAGRNMPDEFYRGENSGVKSGVEVIGEVASAEEFLKRPGILTVPIQSGSGMRIKAVEGMACGKPCVGTSLGLQGLGLNDGENSMISNKPENFANSLILLLKNENLARKIALNGANHVREKFNNKNIIKELSNFLENL